MGEEQEEVGDLYEIQDGVEDGEFEERYDIEMDEEEMIKEEKGEYDDEDDEEWSDD